MVAEYVHAHLPYNLAFAMELLIFVVTCHVSDKQSYV